MSKVVYIVGSLRKDSYNKKLAERMQEVTGGEVVCLNDMVFMNEDLEANPPKVVSDLREKVVAADRIVFVSPEYNYTVPGTLKNAIDWLSRPYGDNKPAIIGKSAAVCGASLSFIGTARMQKDLKGILAMLGVKFYPKDLFVSINIETGTWDEQTDERIVSFAEGL